jgi:tRNA threonylcarbamoyladenosine biosynthesis protein TsaE
VTRSGFAHRGLDQRTLEAWGRRVGAEAGTPLVLALSGPLGAGKSVLARAVARGAGVTGPVPSPTFNLVFRYPTPTGGDVVHLDLYRLAGPDELWELGFEELGASDERLLLEWPERARGHLPEPRWEITLGLVAGHPRLRSFEARPVGEVAELPSLEQAVAIPAPGAP